MTQRWRDLLFLHTAVTPEVVRRIVPEPLQIDTFTNTLGVEEAWIGLVPFRMEGVRARFMPPAPFHSAFPETNVRTYVHLDGVPGVWFFSLDAASAPACRFARRFFHLPYREATMRVVRTDDDVRYTGTRRRGHAVTDIRAQPVGEANVVEPGTLEFFLVERYRLYCADARGWFAGNVHHAPYRTRRVQGVQCSESLLAAAGLPAGSFSHHLFSEGVDVRIDALQRLSL